MCYLYNDGCELSQEEIVQEQWHDNTASTDTVRVTVIVHNWRRQQDVRTQQRVQYIAKLTHTIHTSLSY